MRIGKTTTMPVVNSTRIAEVPTEQLEIFAQVVEMLKPYSKRLDTRINVAGHYELWTYHKFRSNGKQRVGVLFAGLMTYRTHVGLYFFPLHLSNRKFQPP